MASENQSEIAFLHRRAEIPSALRKRHFAVVVLAFMATSVSLGSAWFSRASIVLETELSVTVVTTPALSLLREAVLKPVVEEAHLRQAEIVIFQSVQKANPFRGPHIEVRVLGESAGLIEVAVSLTQGKTTINERFHGSAESFPIEIQKLFNQVLAKPIRAPNASTDAYVTGRLAEARFSRQIAVAEYRRAIALDAGNLEARMALVPLLFEQGLSHEARIEVKALWEQANSEPARRCRVERLLARVAPDLLGRNPCELAAMIAHGERLELTSVLRAGRRLESTELNASEWIQQQNAMILAYLRTQELNRATHLVKSAREIAELAGWSHASLVLETHSATAFLHRGDGKAAADVWEAVGRGFTRLGDGGLAAEAWIRSLRARPMLLGDFFKVRREALALAREQASASGLLRVEIEALLMLASMDRDPIQTWRARLAAVRARIGEAQLDGRNSLLPYFVVNEVVGGREYAAALAELDLLASASNPHPRAQLWALPMRVTAHFWRDELPAAVAGIDAVERSGLHMSVSHNQCFFAWVLTEARMRSRANTYLEGCNATQHGQEFSDHGLIAAARQRMLDHEPSAAWALLRPRLRALLSQPEVTRKEVETLTLIAGLAARLPEADDAMLSQASQLASQSAPLDGAGPRVRLGAALLRDALCMRSPGCRLRTSTRIDEDALLKRLIAPSGTAPEH
jgi:hypothetical protein